MEKYCKQCNTQKNIQEFYKNSKSPDGLRHNCKICQNKISKAWEQKNKDYCDERNKKYRARDDVKKRRCKISKEWNRNNLASVLCTRAKKRSKELGLPFDLQKVDIIIPEICPVLGIPIQVSDEKLNDASPSLDRFIPSLGYTKNNVTVISMRANRMKTDGTLEEIEKLYYWMKERTYGKTM